MAIVYLLGFFIGLLNMFIVNIAYPDIGATFHAGVSELTWIGTSYMLGLTVVMPLSVWLAQRFGEKRLIAASLLLFGIASYGAGSAGSIDVLIGIRFVQGAAAGLLIPVGQAMTYRNYRPAERARLTSIMMVVALMAPAVSPSVGGILVDHISWRWIFWLDIPLAAVNLLLTVLWLQRDPVREPQRFDVRGFALGSLSIITLLVGLSELGEPGGRPLGATLLGVAVASGYFFVRALRNAPAPLLKLSLLKGKMLATSMVVYQSVSGIFTGANVILMLYLQQQLSVSATSTGLLMVPWAAAAALAIGVTRTAFNRIGPKVLFTVGIFLQSLGLMLLFFLAHPMNPVLLIVAYVLMGFGGSLSSSTAQSAAFLDTPSAELGQASALWNINRQASFAVGVAVVGLVLGVFSSMFSSVSDAGAGDPSIAFRWSFVVAAVITLLPLPLVLRLTSSSSSALRGRNGRRWLPGYAPKRRIPSSPHASSTAEKTASACR
ncbi:MFS transporter [Nocardia altamirensis]|uniref:MFS transporter n=1 Tax=Nocardia altamirensis TaxID=472158 RepID=UPI001C3F7861|nr:MFS transporter [Nocardia altamirensis]